MNPILLCLNLAQPVTHYLVKWCSLPYEDSTWELRQDIDQAKIEEFEKLMSREPETERVVRTGGSGGFNLRLARRCGLEKPLMGFPIFETGATSC